MKEDLGVAGHPMLEGHYANVFQVGYNAFEFVIDFGQQYGDGTNEHFHMRVVTSPAHVKALMETLSDSMKRYEESYGDPSRLNQETRT